MAKQEKQIKTAADLKQDSHNYRKHSEQNKARIKKSIDEAGLGRSVVIDADGVLVAGNGVQSVIDGDTPVKVVETDGTELVVVKRTDLHTGDPRRKTLALADNATADDVEWNFEAIEADGWTEESTGEWGVEWPNDEEAEHHDAQAEQHDAQEEQHDAQEEHHDAQEEHHDAQEDDFDDTVDKVETVCKKGDIWKLGNHRLMCGDSTNKDDLKLLLGEVTPDLIYTDPPYGMSAISSSGVLKERYKTDIHGDEDNTIAMNAFKLCQLLFTNSRQVWWGANYYTECLPSSECWLVWDKNNGMSDQTDCELAWSNYRSVVRQFTMVSEKQNCIHPTQKPCKLFADIVIRMKKNDIYNNVLDLFGGSGSTMIACEQMGINSFTMEYDPHYCDVIIARWEKLTGNKAEKVNVGS